MGMVALDTASGLALLGIRDWGSTVAALGGLYCPVAGWMAVVISSQLGRVTTAGSVMYTVYVSGVPAVTSSVTVS